MHYDCTTCGHPMGVSKEHCEVCREVSMDTLDDVLEDLVNHPNHYKSAGEGTIECIDAIQSALTDAEFKGFCKGNVIKYTWRSNRKQDVSTNLEKARWYLSKALETL